MSETGSQPSENQEYDLSHVFANDEDGQEHFHTLPHAAKIHFAMSMAHHMGITKQHPGPYKGPPITVPEDWKTPSDVDEQKTQAQAQAISSIAENHPPLAISPPPTAPQSTPGPAPAPPAVPMIGPKLPNAPS